MPDDAYFLAQEDDPSDYLLAMEMIRGRDGVAKTCGSCREFLGDENGGRGECLHPGSGVLHPWTDTEGCPFWRR